MRGKTVTQSAKKKALVTLKTGKIDMFEEPKKTKKT